MAPRNSNGWRSIADYFIFKRPSRLTPRDDSVPMRRVKFALPFALCLAFATTACNTIENRRSFYANTKVEGPYTRSLEDGSWQHPKSVDQQYAEAQRAKRMPVQRATAPATTPAPSAEVN
jgi:hypothetical protein